MTKDEIILANKEYLFPAIFHYYKEPLVVSRAGPIIRYSSCDPPMRRKPEGFIRASPRRPREGGDP